MQCALQEINILLNGNAKSNFEIKFELFIFTKLFQIYSLIKSELLKIKLEKRN